MKCEVEFLAVGEGSRPGDAIIVRYGDLNSYELMIVDGGNAETGELIVSHLQKYFPGRPVSNVLLTHSDIDHASGLRTVTEKLDVRNVWLHAPWLVANGAKHLFQDPRWTDEGLSKAILNEYDVIKQIVVNCFSRNIPVNTPFQGYAVGPFRVLSPSANAYLHLVPQFDKTPPPNQDAIAATVYWIGKETAIGRLVASLQAKVASWIPEAWGVEALRNDGVTSASNESSVVLYGQFDETGNVLLTGDAGIRALTWAADYAELHGLPLRAFKLVQIPHHGSRRNVGPAILNRLIGEPVSYGSTPSLRAYVSAPKDDETHPRKIVLNAFTRRGADVFATQGQSIINYGGFPARPDYVSITPMPFWNTVEAYT